MFLSPSLSFVSVFQFPSVFPVSLHSVFQLLFVPFIRFFFPHSFLLSFVFIFPSRFIFQQTTNFQQTFCFLLSLFLYLQCFSFLIFILFQMSILASFLLSFFHLSHLPSYFISSFLHLIPSFIKLIFCLLFLCLSLFLLSSFPPSFLISLPKLPYYFLFVFFSL